MKQISLILMAVFYLFSGINHFRMPAFYLRIIPPMLPFPQAINVISGAAEIVLAVLLLVPAVSKYAAWGVIALLIAISPANIYHYTSGGAGMDISQTTLALRLPLQFLLIAWAYWHTR
ncbi:MAG: DoxX-like family protein [Chloroflexota bacterium]